MEHKGENKMISTVFFDLDDTLLWDRKSIKEAFQATCGLVNQVDSETLEHEVRKEAKKLYQSYPTYAFTKMIGINPFEGLWGTFNDQGDQFQKMHRIMPEYRIDAWTNGLKACGIDNPELGEMLAGQFIIERKKHPFVYADTFAVLNELKSDFQLLLLTNGSPSLQQTKLEMTPEIAEAFDHIIISGQFGRGKPDPSIFDYSLKKADVKPEEVIMIGDNLMTDILGANRSNIKNIWINHDNQITDQVKPTYEVNELKEVLPIIQDLK